MIEEKKVLTRHNGDSEMEKVENYIKDGGFEGLKNAFERQPEEIVEEVKKSFLRGRG